MSPTSILCGTWPQAPRPPEDVQRHPAPRHRPLAQQEPLWAPRHPGLAAVGRPRLKRHPPALVIAALRRWQHLGRKRGRRAGHSARRGTRHGARHSTAQCSTGTVLPGAMGSRGASPNLRARRQCPVAAAGRAWQCWRLFSTQLCMPCRALWSVSSVRGLQQQQLQLPLLPLLLPPPLLWQPQFHLKDDRIARVQVLQGGEQ